MCWYIVSRRRSGDGVRRRLLKGGLYMFNSFPVPKPDRGGLPNIKNSQSGGVILSGAPMNVPISPVDLKIAVLRISILAATLGEGPDKICVKATFVNNTTLNLSTVNAPSSLGVQWEVIEFNNVKSLQSGTTSGSANNLISISEMNPNKSLLFFSFSMPSTNLEPSYVQVRGRIQSSSQIQIQNSFAAINTFWQVLEFN